jgi:hypothetical protein
MRISIDRQLSSGIIDFILEWATSSTPAVILRELETAKPMGWETTTAHQWQVATGVRVNGGATLIIFIQQECYFRNA